MKFSKLNLEWITESIFFWIGETSKPAGEAAPESDRREYRRAPQADKKADAGAGAGSFEMVGYLFIFCIFNN